MSMLGEIVSHSVYCACLAWALVNLYVCASFPFGFESRMWDLIVLVPDHCLSFI